MRHSRTSGSLLFVACAGGVAGLFGVIGACGTQDPAPGDADAATGGVDGGPGPVDAAPPRADARTNCPVPTTYGGVTPAMPTATAAAGGSITAQAGLAAGQDDTLIVDLVAGRGPFIDGPVVGDFPLTGAMLDNDSCALCVRLSAGGEDYFATGGVVKVTSVAGTLGFQLLDVGFTHVTIDPTPPHPVTPVGDGCETRISSLTFSAAIAGP